jgi:uncharacterized membrane protein YphA (DoxX/SURF4 family)
MTFFLTLHSFSDWGLLAIRLALCAIFWVHGRGKAGSKMPIMRVLSVCEPLGAAAVLFGMLTQLAALGFVAVMCGAIYSKIYKWNVPFKADDKTGWEFDLMILAASLMLVLAGAGAFSLDRMLLGL